MACSKIPPNLLQGLLTVYLMLQVNLWGLDAIKTKGESVAIVLHLLGARPLSEGTA